MTDPLSSSASTAASEASEISEAADAAAARLKAGGRAVFFGAGRSAWAARHLSEELAGGCMFERPRLDRVRAADADGPAHVGPGDVAICLWAPGDPEGAEARAAEAQAAGAAVAAIAPRGSATLRAAGLPVALEPAGPRESMVAMLAAGHALCGEVERSLFGRRAVFFDRDDTITDDVPYRSTPDGLRLYDGVGEAVAALNAAGFLAVMVTNQSGVGRGLVSPEQLEAVHAEVRRQVAEAGGRIDRIYHCPHRPDEGCGCRKPRIGMGVEAVLELGIDPRRSYMVGDHEKDVLFGRALGCRTYKVGGGLTFAGAVADILRRARLGLRRARACQTIC